jgi:hypothetical protein
MCPHCHKPLFRPKGNVHVTGQCWYCTKSIT